MSETGDSYCPCGSGHALDKCCGRYHGGVAAPSAEALMRSRYSAFVLGRSDYLLATWHPSTRPPQIDLGGREPQWQRLEVIATQAGTEEDDEGVVEFAAFYRGGQLHERSRFLREGGRWCYLDGEMLPPVKAEAPGRNAPCSCGSGKKYKRCCGR